MDAKVVLVAVLVTVTIYGSVSDEVENGQSAGTSHPEKLDEGAMSVWATCDLQYCSCTAKLKSNKEVCLNPETKWLQQYLEKALEKMKKAKQQAN
ncbi:stromal cell-derived factor 1 precursor [Silurus asotus]|uniref:Stromal cell-derived factor 1 n=1 Tax=Silurus asotus TaxID=30991 RepID=A0AAD5F8H9_SILAS|nr:stromal cell-derived factor 1 precursor [Silurus asotus]